MKENPSQNTAQNQRIKSSVSNEKLEPRRKISANQVILRANSSLHTLQSTQGSFVKQPRVTQMHQHMKLASEQSPGPGAYSSIVSTFEKVREQNMSDQLSARQHSNRSNRITQQSRNSLVKDMIAPGPGSYNTQIDLKLKKSPRATIDNAKRITHDHFTLAVDSPGVGCYSSILESTTISGKTSSVYSKTNTTFAGRHETVRKNSPGPLDYMPNKDYKLPKSSKACIGREPKKSLFSCSSQKHLPGPGCYNPKPVLPAGIKASIRLPAPTVYIDLGTPGVGKYNASPVLRRSPTMKMQTAPKVPIFGVKEETPGPCGSN